MIAHISATLLTCVGIVCFVLGAVVAYGSLLLAVLRIGERD